MTKFYLAAVVILIVSAIVLFSAYFITYQMRKAQDIRISAQAPANCAVADNDLVMNGEEQKLLELINAHRQKINLAQLTVSVVLHRAAVWRGTDIVVNNRFDYTDSLGRNTQQRLRDCGIPGEVGEEIASTGTDAQTTFNSWKESSNYLLNPAFKTIGIANVGKYWVVDLSTDSPELTGADCHRLDSSKPVPDNFGASFNVFSPQEVLLKVKCQGQTANITVGTGNPLQYIWPEAYISSNGGSWEKITLAGTKADPASRWLKGSGTASAFVINPAAANWLIAYVCTWDGAQWKCGCRDQSCTGPTANLWQIQRFGQ